MKLQVMKGFFVGLQSVLLIASSIGNIYMSNQLNTERQWTATLYEAGQEATARVIGELEACRERQENCQVDSNAIHERLLFLRDDLNDCLTSLPYGPYEEWAIHRMQGCEASEPQLDELPQGGER